jgi:rhomboid protease GluP
VLLHASLAHLVGNAVVFAVVGLMLEPRIGPRWFAGVFAIGGLGGALASICVNPGNVPGVGASGAIMGVLGAAFFCGASAKAGPNGRKMQTWALRLLLPALIPFGGTGGDNHVDYACHLGGLLAGLATGVALQAAWTRGEDRPALGNAGAVIGGVSLVIALLAFTFGAQPGSAAPQPTSLIPEEDIPANLDIGTEKARALVQRYPRDPRAHLLRGYAFIEEGNDYADAEEQFRQALAAQDNPEAHVSPDFGKIVSALLALTVAYQGRPDSARAIGGPTCSFAAERYDSIHQAMVKAKICDE